MRIHGIGVNLVDLRAYTGLTWAPMAIDARATLLDLNLPWPLYLPVGRLIFYDDLEGVLKWLQYEGTVTRENSAHVFNGDYCLKILTGAVAGNWGHAARILSFPGRGPFRLMCHWHPWGAVAEPGQDVLREFQIELKLCDGTYRHMPTIRYLNFVDAVETRKWQYLNAAGAWTDIPGASQYIHAGMNEFGFPGDNFLALDVDITGGTLKINRLVSNNLDLKNLNLTGYKEDFTITPGVSIRFGVQTNLAEAVAVYIDEVALGDKALPDLV